MRRFLLAGLLLLSFAGLTARAYTLLSTAAAPSYTGPCDLAGGCTLFYGLRAADNTVAAALQASFDWSCTNGSTFTGTVHVTSAGGLNSTDTGTITTDCGAQTVTITKLYEQISGSANAVLGTAPTFLTGSTNCKGIADCISFNSTPLAVTATVSISQSWSIATVSCQRNNAPGGNSWIAAKASTWAVGYGGANNLISMYAGSAVETVSASNCVSSNNQHSFIYIGNNSTTPGAIVDGTANTLAATPGANAISNNYDIGADSGGASTLDALVTEIAFYPIAMNSTQYSAVCHNQFAYWGTSVSC